MFEEENRVIFQGEFLWVHDKQGRLLMKVKHTIDKMYKIKIEEGGAICLITKVEEASWLWHSCLGNVNFPALILMSKDEIAFGLPRLTQPKEIYEGFLMSKQLRKPFPSQSNFSTKSFLELVHMETSAVHIHHQHLQITNSFFYWWIIVVALCRFTYQK